MTGEGVQTRSGPRTLHLERIRRLRQLAPTARQLEALRAYIIHGTHAEAAAALGVTERTFKSHLASIRQRLGVQNTAQAVYVLWMGYRDHIEECTLPDHEQCIPALTDVAFFR